MLIEDESCGLDRGSAQRHCALCSGRTWTVRTFSWSRWQN